VSNPLARVLTALVGIPAIVFVTWEGGGWFRGFVTVIALGALAEWVGMLRSRGTGASLVWALILAGLVLFRHELPGDAVSWILGGVLVLLASVLFRGVHTRPMERLAGTLSGLVYPVWLFSFLIPIRELSGTALGQRDGFILTMTCIALIWMTDTAAYYTGRRFGRTKLAPVISPNKTWEGALGGLAGAFALAFAVRAWALPDLAIPDAIALALIGGAWSQAGDLIESAFKRSAGVKDSASILPGHGGLLDRFDAMIVTVPAYYLYLVHMTSLLG